jgi:hypothetical protein
MRFFLLFLASPHRQHPLIPLRRYVSQVHKSCTTDDSTTTQDGHDRRDYQGDKTSHVTFFRNRDWKTVENFWTSMVKHQSSVPDFVLGDNIYGLADLQSLHIAGMRGEFLSSDYRYSHRQTFAIRLG